MRYKHDNGTAYRAGDLYAEILLGCIRKLQEREPEAMRLAMEKLGIDPAEDPSSWHWDNYWRLFCVIEGVLDRSVLEGEVENIWRQANKIVWGDREHNRMKYTSDFVDVSREPQQTIFPLDANKTFEFSPLYRLLLRSLRQPRGASHADRTTPGVRLGQLGHQWRERIPGDAERINDCFCIWALCQFGRRSGTHGNTHRGGGWNDRAVLPMVDAEPVRSIRSSSGRSPSVGRGSVRGRE
jgi:hypothetical protein